MTEANAVDRIVHSIRLHAGHVQPIENSFGVGIPDLYTCCLGNDHWIEVKNLMELPKREHTPIRLNHPFGNEQRIFFERNLAAGGRPLLIIRVERARLWFVFDGEFARQRVDVPQGATIADWYHCALFQWSMGDANIPLYQFLGSGRSNVFTSRERWDCADALPDDFRRVLASATRVRSKTPPALSP